MEAISPFLIQRIFGKFFAGVCTVSRAYLAAR
jgi:hypothetical protein